MPFRYVQVPCPVVLCNAAVLCYSIEILISGVVRFFRQVQKEMSAPAMKVARGMGKPANVSYFCASRFSPLA